MSKERLIKKIAVNANGLKGLTLSGIYETMKDNKVVENEFLDGVKTPINTDLEGRIEDLRTHVLGICGLLHEKTSKQERIDLMAGCDIVSFEFRKGKLGWLKIKATSRVFDTKFQTLTTPKISLEDGYEHFEPMMETLDEILEEVDQYVKGLKKLSDKDLAVSWIRHKGGDVTMDMLNAMTDEELKDFCVNHIEKKLGGFTILNEDVVEEGEESTEETESTEEVIEEETEDKF
jgi:hypothetical protein